MGRRNKRKDVSRDRDLASEPLFARTNHKELVIDRSCGCHYFVSCHLEEQSGGVRRSQEEEKEEEERARMMSKPSERGRGGRRSASSSSKDSRRIANSKQWSL